MSRSKGRSYAGATGRSVKLGDLVALDSGWAVQPKIDGMYAELVTDWNGVCVGVESRTGRSVVSDLVGIQTVYPKARLIGELTAGTEWGRRQREKNGFDILHMFDVFALDGLPVFDEPYAARRVMLMERQAAEQDRTPDRARRDLFGRYRKMTPQCWRRVPVVEQYAIGVAKEIWEGLVLTGAYEGLVAVDLKATLGARSSKKKCKPSDTLDCVVVDNSRGCVGVQLDGLYFAVPCRKDMSYFPGTVLEVRHEGWYKSGVPRFPRVVRTRPDKR